MADTPSSLTSIPWDDLSDFRDLTSGSFGVVRRADYLGTEVAVKEFLDIDDQPGFDLKKYIGREVEILKVSFAIDIARALVYLHAKKFIHRDMKADNLLLTENLRIKICDFGFSREQVGTPTELKKLSFCGTDAYMAPEIMFALPFDERADIFSFGVILCEIASRTSAMWDQAPDEPVVLNKDDWPEEEVDEEEQVDRVDERSVTVDQAEEQRPNPTKLLTPIKRVVPGFGIDMEALGKWAKREGCPDAFFDLARECCEDEVEKRANLKEVLKKLRTLEEEVVKEALEKAEREKASGGIGWVGHIGAKWATAPRLSTRGGPSQMALQNVLGDIT
ncbi:hypothetical protein HK097_005386 [Rhizophlyctis rosea]|uniref:Protein kinase domain-containing protein n=1 Tax=Rhizophlyctis rosea TaxID=64517 RepID=A0AAD5SGS2_9FUNG|nr:hypothetical protein HK097_005386 [Rhizophlyctis rosea]